ncbi:shiftless antiviral inhibitor of ribosomal frameshifting protein homolog [Chanos chanos]|uniref:Shiftless antiviral inhibitor of ribosomal frameshifting protein homolog n=1 Tax=Chanos chanos TaxID=29144 RepID=A0A6J2WQY6_CHACN|nr:repressor of yield of DENV protein [Chanos chanos]
MYRSRDEVELEKSVRRLREQFHGKIAIDKAVLLMRRYGNNYRMVAMEIVLMKNRDLDSEDIRNLETDPVAKNVILKLQNEEKEKTQSPPPKPKPKKEPKDKDIQDLADGLRVLPLTEKNKRMFDQAQKNLMPSALHQFACAPCDTDWWRLVPERKRVSRCKRCKQKYDPVPAGKMWGIAEFHCLHCTRTFKGFGRMDVGSPCYTCRNIILPGQILPPRKNMIRSKTKHEHSCLAEDCYNRQEPHVPGTECVHPRSRHRNNKPRVVNPSDGHISSGSTVNTCLSQGNLADLYELILEDIREEREEESDSSASGHS